MQGPKRRTTCLTTSVVMLILPRNYGHGPPIECGMRKIDSVYFAEYRCLPVTDALIPINHPPNSTGLMATRSTPEDRQQRTTYHLWRVLEHGTCECCRGPVIDTEYWKQMPRTVRCVLYHYTSGDSCRCNSIIFSRAASNSSRTAWYLAVTERTWDNAAISN